MAEPCQTNVFIENTTTTTKPHSTGAPIIWGCQAARSRGREEKLPAAGGVAPTSFTGGRAGKGENPDPGSAGALGFTDCRALIARAAKFLALLDPNDHACLYIIKLSPWL